MLASQALWSAPGVVTVARPLRPLDCGCVDGRSVRSDGMMKGKDNLASLSSCTSF